MKFEDAIKVYLSDLAENDVIFAKTLKKSNKSIDECCSYIIGEAKKAAANQSVIALRDEDVYNLAVHYYDEDDITAPVSTGGAKVVAAVEKPKATKRKKAAVKPAPSLEPSADGAAVETVVNGTDGESDEFKLEIPVFE